MSYRTISIKSILIGIFSLLIAACASKKIESSHSDHGLGSINFQAFCESTIKADLNTALALLHSFEYDAAREAFTNISKVDNHCAMAYWGIGMSYIHQLWDSPSAADFSKGLDATNKALNYKTNSFREKKLIEALAVYYLPSGGDHRSRMKAYEDVLAAANSEDPTDIEIATFYGLALIANADANDRTFSARLKAGRIMDKFVAITPDHPGLTHYIIHGYDTPELAHLALPAAMQYAVIAPDSAHALHMPSHIFERLGMWNQSIEMNLRSTQAARNYAKKVGIKGHWDEELHGLDFMETAYLQIGNYEKAIEVRDYVASINSVYPENFKVAYAFAATPSRFFLETKNWQGAAQLDLPQKKFPWEKFPYQHAIYDFAVAYGKVRSGDILGAQSARKKLGQVSRSLTKQQYYYQARRVDININIIDAWIALAQNKSELAVETMTKALDLESTMKTPDGPLLPTAEIFGDLYIELKQYQLALNIYEQSLKNNPNRRNSIIGALECAKALDDQERIKKYKLLLDKLSP
jgi:tetratricopeptide (TPR) repeat protein